MRSHAVSPTKKHSLENRIRTDLAEARTTASRATARNRRPRARPERVTLVNNVLLFHSRDDDRALWTLEAHHDGEVSLRLGGQEIAFIPHKRGLPMMAMDACPYIRAAEIVAALLTGLAVELSGRVRAELEVALARWIPLYFEL